MEYMLNKDRTVTAYAGVKSGGEVDRLIEDNELLGYFWEATDSPFGQWYSRRIPPETGTEEITYAELPEEIRLAIMIVE